MNPSDDGNYSKNCSAQAGQLEWMARALTKKRRTWELESRIPYRPPEIMLPSPTFQLPGMHNRLGRIAIASNPDSICSSSSPAMQRLGEHPGCGDLRGHLLSFPRDRGSRNLGIGWGGDPSGQDLKGHAVRLYVEDGCDGCGWLHIFIARARASSSRRP